MLATTLIDSNSLAAGVAMFTRSLAHLGMGIRVNALCPEYVDTPFLGGVPPPLLAILRDNVGLVPMDRVVKGKSNHCNSSTMHDTYTPYQM